MPPTKTNYGHFSIIFFILILDIFFSFILMSFKQISEKIPTWKMRSRVTANKLFFKDYLMKYLAVFYLKLFHLSFYLPERKEESH